VASALFCSALNGGSRCPEDQTGDRPQFGRALHECFDGLARRDVDRGDLNLEASIAEHAGGSLGIRFAGIRDQQLLAHADTAGDRLADLARTDDDDDFFHGVFLRRMFRSAAGDR